MNFKDYLNQYASLIDKRDFVGVFNKVRETATNTNLEPEEFWAKLVVALEKLGINPLEGQKVIPQGFLAGTNIHSVTVPKTITDTGFDFCSDCKELERVDFERDSQLKSLDSFAFAGCVKLKSISIPDSVGIIGRSLFSGDEELEEVKLPAGLKTLTEYTFHNCHKLKKITIPTALEKISYNVFSNCVALDMDPLSFEHTQLKVLGSSCFANCLNLKTIILPPTLKAVADEPFDFDENLTNIIYKGNKENILSIVNSLGPRNNFGLKAKGVQCNDGFIEFT